jgi:hypothetical protein
MRTRLLSLFQRTSWNVSEGPGVVAVATTPAVLLTPTNWLPKTRKLNVVSLILHSCSMRRLVKSSTPKLHMHSSDQPSTD